MGYRKLSARPRQVDRLTRSLADFQSWSNFSISHASSGVLNNYSPAMHSTAETMTAVSAIYRPTSGRLPQG